MVQVSVNGMPMPADLAGLRTMGDIIELVKANVDPEQIVTGVFVDGDPICEADWRSPLVTLGNRNVDIKTGTKEFFANERLQVAGGIVDSIMEGFGKAQQAFLTGNNRDGNLSFAQAIEDLSAFLNWYLTVLSVDQAQAVAQRTAFGLIIKDIQTTCEQMMQQQLYQSWWALGESIRMRLEPQLQRVKLFCTNLAGE